MRMKTDGDRLGRRYVTWRSASFILLVVAGILLVGGALLPWLVIDRFPGPVLPTPRAVTVSGWHTADGQIAFCSGIVLFVMSAAVAVWPSARQLAAVAAGLATAASGAVVLGWLFRVADSTGGLWSTQAGGGAGLGALVAALGAVVSLPAAVLAWPGTGRQRGAVLAGIVVAGVIALGVTVAVDHGVFPDFCRPVSGTVCPLVEPGGQLPAALRSWPRDLTGGAW
jgi:hypothetical protein